MVTARFAIVEDGSLFLERSGCCIFVSGSWLGGLKAAPTTLYGEEHVPATLFRLCYAWKGLSTRPVMS